jgi:uncharacterized protein
MKFNLADEGNNYTIRAYDHGELLIDEYRCTSSVIVMPKQIINDWMPQRFADLTCEHFTALAKLNPQIVILGTGATIQFPDPVLYADLLNKGIGVEIMATPAACRTYNLLVAEGREVAAALLLT